MECCGLSLLDWGVGWITASGADVRVTEDTNEMLLEKPDIEAGMDGLGAIVVVARAGRSQSSSLSISSTTSVWRRLKGDFNGVVRRGGNVGGGMGIGNGKAAWGLTRGLGGPSRGLRGDFFARLCLLGERLRDFRADVG